ncbi:hypothetical protein [Paenibacillus sp. TC-CSREp1]|uniref:hypothetical protein n=1 Tax=Paenibacillus sp. TC-CSREp1 TaxID=3410089 RepID=UPI003CEE3EB0
MSLLLYGCGSSKFEEYKEQAREHYLNNEYASAVTVYSKALDEKEDPEVRTELGRIEGEVARIKEVTSMYDELKDSSVLVKNTYKPDDTAKYIRTVIDTLAKLEAFDTSSNDNPAIYVKPLVSSNDFINVKLKAGLADVNQNYNFSDKSTFEYALELAAEVEDLLSEYPLRPGFAEVR